MGESETQRQGGTAGEGGRSLKPRQQDFTVCASPTSIKQYMNHKGLVIALYVVVSLAQIAPPTASSKLDPKTLASDSGQGKALRFLLKAHPELQNYAIYSYIDANAVQKEGDSAGQGTFIFKLQSASKMLLARVMVGSGEREQSASLGPAVTADSDLTLPPVITLAELPASATPSSQSGSSTGETSIINQPVIQLPAIPKNNNRLLAEYSTSGGSAASQLNSYAPGSYQPLANASDPRQIIATSYLATLHPNIINYRLVDVQYQITAGMNLMLNYTGRNEFTRVLAFVNVDLKLQPTLLDFFVMCNTTAINCTDAVAGLVFAGEEYIMSQHTELATYLIVGMAVEDNNLVDSIMVMITYEDAKQKLRSLVELKVVSGKPSISSYYSFSIPPAPPTPTPPQ